MGLRGAIVAMSPERVIGQHGGLPWHYPADLKRFKRLTLVATIIMGRHTWESIGSRPLPGRRNVVVTSKQLTEVACFASIDDALVTCIGDVWFIGGAQLYAEALAHCDLIDVTLVPDRVDGDEVVFFPELNPEQWQAGPLQTFSDDKRLSRQRYWRRAGT